MVRTSSRGKRSRVLADKTNAIDMPSKKRVCVYSNLDTSPAKKGRRSSKANDVYQFETDGKEEPRSKFKKNKKKKVTAVKRLQKQPAVRPKKRQQPPNRAVSHSIKPPPRAPQPKVQSGPGLQLRPNFPAHVPAALRKESPALPPLPAVTSTPLRRADDTVPFVPSTPLHCADDTDLFVPPSPCEEPPLDRLFDDDCPALPTPPTGPTRFDWRELAEARARVVRTSLPTPRQSPSVAAAEVEAPQEAQRLRQTSILSFVAPPLGCSTPVRPTTPEHCSMLSPEKEKEPEEQRENVRPTRLTINTLKQVIQASKETLAQQPPPPSPKRHFNRPPRKSYEKLSKKKALDFLELESEPEVESEPEDLFCNEDEPESEEEEQKIKKKQKKKRQNATSKAFEAWAKKFNKELEVCEGFDLAVE
ncbi:Hypothetical predicted protein [Cloeon dipterum]|uniref:Uncharacterized protein n=1 Tax=Cloeon dipterum TaxID=197152 RepID=A0A8S1DSK6_9INSE|nr:Hypothetical predicted protein [Cloeon dipterum]